MSSFIFEQKLAVLFANDEISKFSVWSLIEDPCMCVDFLSVYNYLQDGKVSLESFRFCKMGVNAFKIALLSKEISVKTFSLSFSYSFPLRLLSPGWETFILWFRLPSQRDFRSDCWNVCNIHFILDARLHYIKRLLNFLL